MEKIRLSLRRNATQTTTTTVQYEGSLLNNRDIKVKYTLTLKNKFYAHQEISETPTRNNEYKNFVNAHSEAEAECIQTKQQAKPRVPWETLAVIKKQANVKIAFQGKIGRTQPNINTQKLKKAHN